MPLDPWEANRCEQMTGGEWGPPALYRGCSEEIERNGAHCHSSPLVGSNLCSEKVIEGTETIREDLRFP